MSFAEEFLEMINRFQSIGREIYDDTLQVQFLQQQIDIIQTPIIKYPPRNVPYFSPSSANSCKRELYVKAIGQKRDQQERLPFQTRWQLMGTAFGSVMQYQLLLIEKWYPQLFGTESPFYFERNEKNQPKFEDFAKRLTTHHHRNHDILLFGAPDGILIHRATGTRVLLECKTKQTTYGATGNFKMKEPSQDHARQTICYSLQHTANGEAPLNDVIVLYGNLSKKSWNMSREEMEKHPDLRAFDVHITASDRLNVLDTFADVLDAVATKTPPALELDKFLFNNFKTECALSLSNEEWKDISKKVSEVQKSDLPNSVKTSYLSAWEYISEVRD
jgi:hypothetical protein